MVEATPARITHRAGFDWYELESSRPWSNYGSVGARDDIAQTRQIPERRKHHAPPAGTRATQEDGDESELTALLTTGQRVQANNRMKLTALSAASLGNGAWASAASCSPCGSHRAAAYPGCSTGSRRLQPTALATLLICALLRAAEAQPAPFVSEGGSFSLLFPGPPIQDVLTVPTPEGPQTRHVFRYSDDELIIFVWLACTPPPTLPADPEKALDLARQEARNVNGLAPSVSERKIQVSGRPAREFVDNVLGQKSFGRTVIGQNGAFYSVSVGARSQAVEAKAMAILKSFALRPTSSRSLCRAK